MQVENILQSKGAAVHTVSAGAPLSEAVRLLNAHKIGAVVVVDAKGKGARTPVYDGARLGAGAVVNGPAIIEEVTTTIVIEPGWTAKLDASGSYVITHKRKTGGR